MRSQKGNWLSSISYDPFITVFLRAFLTACGGAVAAYSLIAAGSYLNILDGSEALFVFPILCIGSGIWFMSYAKRRWGNHWGIGVSGIFGILTVLVLLFFVLGTSL